jgi:hypothetical protein
VNLGEVAATAYWCLGCRDGDPELELLTISEAWPRSRRRVQEDEMPLAQLRLWRIVDAVADPSRLGGSQLVLELFKKDCGYDSLLLIHLEGQMPECPQQQDEQKEETADGTNNQQPLPVRKPTNGFLSAPSSPHTTELACNIPATF